MCWSAGRRPAAGGRKRNTLGPLCALIGVFHTNRRAERPRWQDNAADRLVQLSRARQRSRGSFVRAGRVGRAGCLRSGELKASPVPAGRTSISNVLRAANIFSRPIDSFRPPAGGPDKWTQIGSHVLLISCRARRSESIDEAPSSGRKWQARVGATASRSHRKSGRERFRRTSWRSCDCAPLEPQVPLSAGFCLPAGRPAGRRDVALWLPSRALACNWFQPPTR